MGFLFGTSVALADGAAAAETSNYSLNVGETLMGLVRDTGFGAFFVGDGWKMLAMIIIGCVLLYLAIHKGFEPLLLLPIGFGMILSNLPLAGLMEEGGLLYYLYKGVKLGIYPPLIFLGVGAMTDFGPLIANPKSLFLGAAAQLGIFIAFTGAILLGRSPEFKMMLGEMEVASTMHGGFRDAIKWVQPEAMQMLYDYLLDAITTPPPAKKLFGIL